MKKKVFVILVFLISSLTSFAQTSDQDSIRAVREHEQDSIRAVRLSEQQAVRSNTTTAKPEKVKDNTYRSCLYVSLGPSIPTGDFSAADINNANSGFATSGAIFDLGFTYKFDANFGMVATIRGMANQVDVDKLTAELNKAYPARRYYNLKSDPWSTGALMLGGLASASLDSRNQFFVEGKAMLGFVSVTVPKQQGYVVENGITYYVETNEADGGGIGFCLMGGLRYNATKRIALMLDLDYFTTKANFKEQNNGGTFTPAFSQKVSTLNFSFSVGYMFK